jgi:hypothetical protein
VGANGSAVGVKHYAASRKIIGPIPDEIIKFFNLPNISSRIMSLGSTQSITDMSTNY